jgi:(S)-2-hydroxyglutarate dehydrogenase
MHPESDVFDITIIGGGIVGLSSAYKISKAQPGLRILLLEKEERVAWHQTGRNSGVLHSGIYYRPGSYKAKNCVSGRREMVAFAREHGISHDICGKVIVATHESELAHMEKVFRNGQANEVEGIEIISAEQIREIEPHVLGIKGIWVPCTGIIDFVAVCTKLTELIKGLNPENRILTSTEALDFKRSDGIYNIKTNRAVFKSRFLISSAGLQADRIARKEGNPSEAAIIGFRGDYYELSEKGKSKVRNLVYPVPNPKYPFLGVHFTRMVDGSYECGPNAVFVFKREGYLKTDFSLSDTAEALSYGGTWRFFFRNLKFAVDEYRGAFSKSYFLQRLRKLIPDLQMDDIEPGRAGVRAMALSPQGEMLDDFKIEKGPSAIHIINAPSPAATAALAIGETISNMAFEHFKLNK